ncbi:MAG TPA: hypothetical protein VK581_08390 [Chthoniobacterales bacterium]|nr:hypothetical protein [Chthoniobacterales bacterium]
MTLDRNITIEQLVLGGAGFPGLLGGVNGSKKDNSRGNVLSVRSNFDLNQAVLSGNATLNALGAATISGQNTLYGWAVILSGQTTWSGRLGVGNGSVIENMPGATLGLSPGAICTYYSLGFGNPNDLKRTLNNYGAINANNSGTVSLDVTLNNLGSINISSGKLVLNGGGIYSGPINLANNATLDFESSTLPTGTNQEFAQSSSISGVGSVTFNSWSPVAVHGFYNITGTTTVGEQLASFRRLTALAARSWSTLSSPAVISGPTSSRSTIFICKMEPLPAAAILRLMDRLNGITDPCAARVPSSR